MVGARLRRYGVILGVVGLGAGFAGCDALSPVATCEEFQSEQKSITNTKLTDMVSKAYFHRFSDENSVSGLTVLKNLELVRVGCNQDPDGKIDRFVEQ